MNDEQNKLKKWLTWKHQLWVLIGIIAVGFILGQLLEQNIYINIARILGGLLYILHPVGTKNMNPKQTKIGCHIARAILLFNGLF